jgi:hypothetical protein
VEVDAMLAKDQLSLIAEEIDRTADARLHDCQGQLAREHLWEVVRRASHAIQAVAGIEDDEVGPQERRRRARYLETELETALAAARQARRALDWSHGEMPSA